MAGPATGAEQRAKIKKLIEDNAMQVGATWYPISLKWFAMWKRFTAFEEEGDEVEIDEGSRPGEIDNSDLVGEYPIVVDPSKSEKYDYELVCEPVWKSLKEWYGGGPEFPREVIEIGFMPRVDMYPQYSEVQLAGDDGEPAGDVSATLLYRSYSARQVQLGACKAVGLDTKNVRVWVKIDDKYVLCTTQPMEIIAGNEKKTSFLVEKQNADGKFVRPLPDALEDRKSSALSAEEMVEWRKGLAKDTRLDAQDNENKWYHSVIVSVISDEEAKEADMTATPKRSAGATMRVHFLGWADKWDLWFKRDSEKLQPEFTKVPNWRDFRVNDKVEIKVEGRWFLSKVEKVDREKELITCKGTEDAKKKGTFSFTSDLLSQAYTHTKRNRYTTQSSWSWTRSSKPGRTEVEGAVGLDNLGNTCFMNSMLQCLSNCEVLTKYFLDKRYMDHINRDNPLGCGGRLAEAYANLMEEMWGGEYVWVSPVEFKKMIGERAPQFAGFQQQDSQELMSFLMDGLHEDLNRIKKKPYTETVDSNGRPDAVVAAEAWETYLKRNTSSVVDMFGGQLRSHVSCNVCDRESITFDPFLSVSVPLPVQATMKQRFSFIPFDCTKPPIRYRATLQKQGSIADLKAWLSKESGLSTKKMLAADVFSHRVYKFFNDRSPLSDIRSNDVVFVYEVPLCEEDEAKGSDDEGEEAEATASGGGGGGGAGYGYRGIKTKHVDDVVRVQMRREVKNRNYNASYLRSEPTEMAGFGDPKVFSLWAASGKRDTMPTNRQVFNAVWDTVKRFITLAEGQGPENPPYKLSVIRKGGYSHLFTLECNDEEFKIDLGTQAVAVEFALDGFSDICSLKEIDAFEKDKSLDEVAERAKGLSLYDCFEKFNQREQLGKTDMWYCAKCKEHRQAYKKMGLWKTPEVLIVHLKRFQYQQGQFFVHRDKLDQIVDFPISGLDLSEYIIGEHPDEAPPIYDLFAVSNHAGGLGGGHYTAIAKNFKNGKWYDFNDQFVSPSSVDRVVSRSSYVLFYKRREAGAKVEA